MLNNERITIKTARGHFTIDIAGKFPCTKKDFSMILEMINECQKENDAALETIREYINARIEANEKFLEVEKNATSNYAIKDKNRATTDLKKYMSMQSLLAKVYGDEKKTSEEIIKYKKTKVHVVKNNTVENKAEIKTYDGFSFEKYGHKLHVYKTERRARWEVIAPYFGLLVCAGRTKAAAVAMFTEELADKLAPIEELKEERAKNIRAAFVQLMKEAGHECQEMEPEKAAKATTETTATKDAATNEKDHTSENKRFFDRLAERYGAIYDYLYNHDNTPENGGKEDYFKALSYFDDEMTEHEKSILQGFCKYIGDFVSSDREAAAYILALWELADSTNKAQSAKEQADAHAGRINNNLHQTSTAHGEKRETAARQKSRAGKGLKLTCKAFSAAALSRYRQAAFRTAQRPATARNGIFNGIIHPKRPAKQPAKAPNARQPPPKMTIAKPKINDKEGKAPPSLIMIHIRARGKILAKALLSDNDIYAQ